MRNSKLPDPDRVLITEHAIHRYLMRYPDDVLPVRPEREIRALLRVARPANPHHRRVFAKALSPQTVLLEAHRWVLPVVPCNRKREQHEPGRAWDWVLPTVMRAERHVNHALEFQRERLDNWRAFRSGQADQLLLSLAAELGTTDVHELAKHWRVRGYPPVQHGGYPSFDEYHRSRLKILRTALQEPTAPPAR